MIGGAAIGQVIDRKGMKISIVCSMSLVLLAFGLMLYYIHTYEFSWLTYVVTFVWGLQDSTMNNIMNCTLGFEFQSIKDDGDRTTPFSV